jgi:hypothetical protein
LKEGYSKDNIITPDTPLVSSSSFILNDSLEPSRSTTNLQKLQEEIMKISSRDDTIPFSSVSSQNSQNCFNLFNFIIFVIEDNFMTDIEKNPNYRFFNGEGESYRLFFFL